MSLYHEAAQVLTADGGGNLKSRIFGRRDLTSPPAQLYALALETCRWSAVLREVVENSDLLRHERKLSPVLGLLLVHDHLLARAGIALPQCHGLRAAVTRHKARLAAEFTRARLRRGAGSIAALREAVSAEFGPTEERAAGAGLVPRWVRINVLKTDLATQLATTFAGFERALSLRDLLEGSGGGGGGSNGGGGGMNERKERGGKKQEKERGDNIQEKERGDDMQEKDRGEKTQENAREGKEKDRRVLYLDQHVPDLVAVPLGVDLTKTAAYLRSEIILQDKASCFPAYLLDPLPGGGDVIDACAAPGNKTTHLAAILQRPVQPQLHSKRRAPPTTSSSGGSGSGSGSTSSIIFAFERDKGRAATLASRTEAAGAGRIMQIGAGVDFLDTDPGAAKYSNVTCLLLDPSCSGSGIVGRDYMPPLHLPSPPEEAGRPKTAGDKRGNRKKGKRRRDEQQAPPPPASPSSARSEPGPDPGPSSGPDPRRLASLAAFQLAVVTHAFAFPAARRVAYSTCSVHDEENEQVAAAALASPIARRRGWRVLRRDEQVAGMRAWPVRGRQGGDADDSADEGAAVLAEGCIRSFPGDGNGVIGFFAVAFVREGSGSSGSDSLGSDSSASSSAA